MAYQSLKGDEQDALNNDTETSHEPTSSPPSPRETLPQSPLSTAFELPALVDRSRESRGDGIGTMIKSMLSPTGGYEAVEEEDYEAPQEPMDNLLEIGTHHAERVKSQVSTSNAFTRASGAQNNETSVRTVSREGSMRHHPTPDLQSLQGAYVGNVQRLEETAEKLSINSDIGEELRKLRMEQRISESRQSSVYSQRTSEPHMDAISRHLSSGSSHAISFTNRARSGGFLPMGYVTSPIGSLRSPSESQPPTSRADWKGAHLSEPEKEGRPLDSPSVPVVSPQLRQPFPERPLRVANGDQTNDTESASNFLDPPDRPTTALSADTFQQANTLFADFDGVHISPSRMVSTSGDSRHLAVDVQTSTVDKPAEIEAAKNENLVYYPAPVPVMLNLPQKLSKLPGIPQGKRRTQLLGALNPAARKSVFGVDDVPEERESDFPEKDRTSMAPDLHRNFPPQLRASMFFEQPSIPQNIEIQGASAVATLDSILDASAFAPVSAFIDHPFAGRIGADVYSKSTPGKFKRNVSPGNMAKRESRSSVNLLGKRNSSATFSQDKQNTMLDSDGQRKSSAPGFERSVSDGIIPYLGNKATLSRHPREDNEEEDDQRGLEDEGLLDPGEEVNGDAFQNNELYDGPPTTLLAELQMRKAQQKQRNQAQQKQRNRAAATAFPGGIHSTLLQLDAVAQVEKKKRERKYVRLAWEDPEVRHPGKENQDDDDVPLGVLFSERKGSINQLNGRFDEGQPPGLIAIRAAEENEPLSQRRSRLKGEVPRLYKQSSRYTLDAPGFAPTQSGTDVNDDETLAQRLKRLKGLKNSPNVDHTITGGFTSEVMNQFCEHKLAEQSRPATNDSPDVDGEEETLGQRRKRLQAEQLISLGTNGNATTPPIRPPANKRHSMADILHAHPASGVRSYSFHGIQTSTSSQAKADKRASVGLLQQHELLRGGGGGGGQQTYLKPHLRASITVSPVVTAKRQSTTAGTGYFPGPGTGILQTGSARTGYALHTPSTTVPYLNPLAYNGSYMGMPNGPSSTMTLPLPGIGGQDQVPLDPKQMAQIDRWRQSIRY